MGSMAAAEAAQLARGGGVWKSVNAAIVAAMCVALAIFPLPLDVWRYLAIGLIASVVLLRFDIAEPPAADTNRDWRALGALLWVAVPIALILSAKSLLADQSRSSVLLLCMAPLWAGDTLAYFVGRRFGRRPLAPHISPNKTVEGALANLAGCIATGVVLCLWIPVQPWFGAVLGSTCGVFGQFGDLFESEMKRRVGAKDSGSILPGHGGVLDRIDSLLFAAPICILALMLLLSQQG